jgi:MYXO-CTERM domain-containing protein
VQRGSVGNCIPLFEILPLLEKKMKFSSVFSGLLVAAASTLATHAGIVSSGPINVEVTQASPYTMTITEDGMSFSWLITNVTTYQGVYGGYYVFSTFSPVYYTAGVATLQAEPENATQFAYGSSIGGGSWYTPYPETVYLRRESVDPPAYENNGNFSSSAANQYAGFSFVGPSGVNFYGWLSVTMNGQTLVVNSFAYTNGPIGAGMYTPAPGGDIPAPGAIALLGLVGLVGGRRRA